MDFTYSVPADATSPGGISRVRSRWLSSGAGRSDVSLVSTDLAATYTTNECWDTSYLSVYKAASYSTIGAANWGNESDCAFKTAQYSDL
jgi:hypothetical protein